MEYCHDLATKLDRHTTWFGYMTVKTLKKLFVTSCTMFSLYLFFISLVAIFILLYYIWKNSSRKKCKNLWPGRIFSKLRAASKNTLADYLTDSPNLRTFYYVVGVFSITVGFLALVLIQGMGYSDNLATARELKGLSISVLIVIWLILGVFSSLSIITEIFILTSIGSQAEMLSLTKNPTKMINLTRSEKQMAMRFNLKKSLVVVVMSFSMPAFVIGLGAFARISERDFSYMQVIIANVAEFGVAYYLFSRMSFVFQEKYLMKVMKENFKLENKMYMIQKFFEDCGPTKLIRNFESNGSFANEINLVKLSQWQLDIFERKLELLQEENSVPIPRNVFGRTLLIPKIYLVLQFAILVLRRGLLVGWFSPSGNSIGYICIISSVILSLFVIRVLTLVIFHSKILLGEETETVDEDDSILEMRKESGTATRDLSVKLLV